MSKKSWTCTRQTKWTRLLGHIVYIIYINVCNGLVAQCAGVHPQQPHQRQYTQQPGALSSTHGRQGELIFPSLSLLSLTRSLTHSFTN